MDILLQFCPVLGAKPELSGVLKFREVDSLNLKFADGRGGARPFVMFPDSRRADKKWGGFKQLTEMILREDRRARSCGPGTTSCRTGAPFPRRSS
jgi:heptosyltransferase I